MSLTAHCPSCHRLLDPSSSQAVTECQCGARVIVSTEMLAEVEAKCEQCGTTYVVDLGSGGGAFDCECESIIVVPMVVVPAQDDGSSRIDTNGNASAEAGTNIAAAVGAESETQTACPLCGQEYFSILADRGKSAICECGCLFEISKEDGNARLVDQSEESSAASVVAVASEPRSAGNGSASSGGAIESEPRSLGRRRRASKTDSLDDGTKADQEVPKRLQVPWFQLVLGVGVGGLLLVGIVMFGLSANRLPDAVPNGTDGSSSVERYGSVSDETIDLPVESIIATDANVEEAVSVASQLLPARSKAEPAGTTPVGVIATSGEKQAAAVPPIKLPAQAVARTVVPISHPRSRGLTFKATYEAAFRAFDRATEMQADAESGDGETVTEYHDSLGLAIGWMQVTLARCGKDSEQGQEHEIRYLLSYLSFLGGRLADASVYGEAAARWGDPKEASTREAAMIALAAMQEANSIHWGLPRAVGELDRMQGIAELIQLRWPDEPQRDLIWASLGQSFESFGADRKAIATFGKVRRSSDQYMSAKLSSGRLRWKLYQSDESAADLAAADKDFRQGLKLMTAAKGTPVKSIVNTKLTLARIAVRQKRSGQVVSLLTKGVGAPLKHTSIAAGKGFKLSKPHSAVVYETLANAQQMLGETAVSAAAFANLAKVSPADAARVESLQWRRVTEMAESITAAASRKRGKVTSKQLDFLDQVAKPVDLSQDAIPVAEVLWFAESFAGFVDPASTPGLRKRCFGRAIGIYQAVLLRPDFPAASLLAAKLRLGDLMSQAGRHEDALTLIGDVLAGNPNVFDLQFQAAESLTVLARQDSGNQDAGKASDASEARIRESLSGRRGTKIWGWFKFVQVIYPVRHSGSGTEKHIDQLRTAQLRLAQTQWQLSEVTSDAAERASLQASVKKQLRSLESSFSGADSGWQREFSLICKQAGVPRKATS